MTAPRKRHDSQSTASALLLAWYDANRRDLPWRAKEGARAEPYHVWLSEIMLQQTTVASVKPYFARFLAQWPDVHALAKAPDEAILAAWAGLGYYARARNLIVCARAVSAAGGCFPDSEGMLRALPGIGDYTAAAIAAIAFQRPAVVVDGNIERIVTRLFAISTPLPKARVEIRAALAPLVPAARPGDFAQALMDLGASVCTPRAPNCAECPLRTMCRARAAGEMLEYPVKARKKTKPVKRGIAFVIRDDGGRVLLGTRPAKGLLGAMAEVPNTGWAEGEAPPARPPIDGEFTPLNMEVRHVFTHFELRLAVQVARVAAQPAPAGLRWVEPGKLAGEPLPTLFRKVLELAP